MKPVLQNSVRGIDLRGCKVEMYEKLVEAIQEWVRNLSSQAAKLEIEETEGTVWLHVVPGNKSAARISLNIDKSLPQFDVYIDGIFRFEDMKQDVALALEICQAVADGLVSVEVFSLGPLLIRRNGSLQLPRGMWHESELSWFSFLGRLARRRIQRYEPY